LQQFRAICSTVQSRDPSPVPPKHLRSAAAAAAMPPAGSLTADQLSFFDANGNHVAVPPRPLNLSVSQQATGDESPNSEIGSGSPLILILRGLSLVPGYLVLESFSSAEEVQAMRDRMSELVEGYDGANSSVFSTKDHVCPDERPIISNLPYLFRGKLPIVPCAE
jgi:hypothetical protein